MQRYDIGIESAEKLLSSIRCIILEDSERKHKEEKKKEILIAAFMKRFRRKKIMKE